MMNLFNAFVSAIFILTISGCGGTPSVPQKKEVVIPSWINSVLPNDTKYKMYGMSIAKDRQNAINAALTDMVSRLGTTIESSYRSDEKVQNSYSSLTIKNTIKADIAKIKVNNYKVINSYKINYKEFAVMIETDKIKFISGLKDNLTIQEKDIQQEYDSLSSKDVLTKYNVKKDLAKDTKKLMPTVLILSELDNDFDKAYHLNFISTKEKEFLSQSNSLRFNVNGDAKSTKFIDKIKNYLATNGFNIVNSQRDAVLVKLATKDNINKSGITIAVLTVNISVFDNFSRIGGKSIILKERYNSSMQSVYKNAAIHFEQDMKNEGINNLIGINLNMDK